MYNRYIPQADGSFQRKQVREPPPTQPPQKPAPPCPEPSPAYETPPPPQPPNKSIPGFFRQLLPRGMETTDLLILVLLLLMAGEREEDRNNALLTIALYFIL